MPCDITGEWFSEAGGMILKICAENQTKVQVRILDATPKKTEGFMLLDKYQFDGIMPFPRSGMILINGVADETKHAATFIGNYYK